MLLLLPVLLLLAAVFAVLALRLARRLRFAYFWLIAALGALLVWPIVLWLGGRLPLEMRLVTWEPESLFPVSPALIGDSISWSFSLAIAALLIAVILSDVSRTAEADWLAWAGSLLLAALGLLAVFSANVLMLLLAWTAIDLAEFVIQILQGSLNHRNRRVIAVFAGRIAGTVLLILAGALAQASGTGPEFGAFPPAANLLLILSSGFRLGVFPLHLPRFGDTLVRRGQGTLLHLVPAASGLVLLARSASTDIPVGWGTLLFFFSGLAALFTAVLWSNAEDELEGRPFWILGTAALALGAAVRGEPLACLAWGLASLLPGGLLFLFSTRSRALLLLPILGLIGFSTLPFTPTWDAVRLYAPPFSIAFLFFLPAQALLLSGYLFHALRPAATLAQAERWVALVYPLGLFFLPLTHFLIPFISYPLANFPSLQQSWPGPVALALMGIFLLLSRFTHYLPDYLPPWLSTLRRRWLEQQLAQPGQRTFNGLERSLALVTRILEGQAGLLWSLMVLTLLLSWLLTLETGG